MTDLRIGAIGCGYWGPNLIRNFVEIPGASVIAVSDLQVEPMNRMRQRFPEIEYAVRDYREMFTMNLDAVVIATPPATHHAIARDCLEHGLHVLVEKPITLNSEDAPLSSSRWPRPTTASSWSATPSNTTRPSAP
jgi:predicted dehydrogenase